MVSCLVLGCLNSVVLTQIWSSCHNPPTSQFQRPCRGVSEQTRAGRAASCSCPLPWASWFPFPFTLLPRDGPSLLAAPTHFSSMDMTIGGSTRMGMGRTTRVSAVSSRA